MCLPHGALVVFGSGPGVGRGVAAFFAEQGFGAVVLISRNATRLQEDAEVVRSASKSANVHTISADLGDTESVQKCLKKTEEYLRGKPLQCVLFNAARLGKSELLTFPADSLENDLRIAVVGLYTVAQWAMPQLLDSASKAATPSALLITSGMLAKDPSPGVFSLATCKAAQYSLMHSLHKVYEEKGVHCGVIIIGGTVSGKSEVTNARNIASEAFTMFKESKGRGQLENVMMDPGFAEHVKNRG